MGLILFLPELLLAVLAGFIADHLDRRVVTIVSGAATCATIAVFALLAFANTRSLPAYYVALACYAIAVTLGIPALRSMLASIVQGEHYLRGSALISSVSEFAAIAGPAIAGLLIALDVPLAFAASCALQAIAVAAVFFLGPQRPEHADESMPSLWRSTVEGLRFIRDRKIILGAISLDLFAVLFGGATALLPIYAVQVLHVGATGYGLLRAAPSVGAALVGIALIRRPIRRNGARWLFWCIAGFGLSTIVFGLSRNMPLSLIALAGVGGFDMVSMVIRNAITQLRVPEAMRGRVSAIENIFIGASNELGMFESGAVAAWLGPVLSVVLGGVATLAVVALWVPFFPALRRFDRLEEA